MVAYGVVHDCIGKCGSNDYLSNFTSLGDEDVLRFLNGTGIEINVENSSLGNDMLRSLNGTGIEINTENIAIKHQNNDSVCYGIIICLICVILGLFGVIGFLYVRRYGPFIS